MSAFHWTYVKAMPWHLWWRGGCIVIETDHNILDHTGPDEEVVRVIDEAKEAGLRIKWDCRLVKVRGDADSHFFALWHRKHTLWFRSEDDMLHFKLQFL